MCWTEKSWQIWGEGHFVLENGRRKSYSRFDHFSNYNHQVKFFEYPLGRVKKNEKQIWKIPYTVLTPPPPHRWITCPKKIFFPCCPNFHFFEITFLSFALFWEYVVRIFTILGNFCQNFYFFGIKIDLIFLAKELAKLKSFGKKVAKYALFWEKNCTVGGYKVSKLALLRLKFPPPH